MQNEYVSALRALRSCGFTTIVNPMRSSMKGQSGQNKGYIKAAAILKGHDIMALLAEADFVHFIESIGQHMPIAISQGGRFNADFVEKVNDIITLANALRAEIQGMSNELESVHESSHRRFSPVSAAG